MSLNFKKGDTLVEVAFAIAIFALVSLICINVMNAGLNSAQNSLEASMARNEIDAQAEAIRFVHNAFTLEREEVIENQQYRDLWDKLSRDSNSGVSGGMANEATSLPELSVSACSEIYDKNSPKSIFKNDLTAFVMNTRMIDPEDQTFNNGVKDLNKIIVSTRNLDADNIFTETPLYPRLLFADNVSGSNISNTNSDAELAESSEYRYLARAEGIWVIAIKDETKSSQNGGQLIPEFFDFHIRTCWYGPGGTRPNTIGTIVRLYNPELIERIK